MSYSSNAPKKPKSGFMHFATVRRNALKVEMPGLSVADCSKVIGAEWRDLLEVEKQPFEEMARRDRERYREEKDAWNES